MHIALSLPRRITLFRVLAALTGVAFLLTLPQAISPWGPVTLSNYDGVSDPGLHRWSAALAGGPDIGGAAVLLYLAWRPGNPALLLQWVALATVVFLAVNVPFVGLYVAAIAIPNILVLAVYPHPRALLTRPWECGFSIPLLVLGVGFAAFLLPDATSALAAQSRGG